MSDIKQLYDNLLEEHTALQELLAVQDEILEILRRPLAGLATCDDGRYLCVFCRAHHDGLSGFQHEADCVISKVRGREA